MSYIEPGSPWENPFVGSLNHRVRDELLNIEEFGSLREAQVLVEAWRVEYNTYRPHSALGGLTPAEYAEEHTVHEPAHVRQPDTQRLHGRSMQEPICDDLVPGEPLRG